MVRSASANRKIEAAIAAAGFDSFPAYVEAERVPVAEVASVGGYVREYQVDVDPDAMRAHRVTLDQVVRAVEFVFLFSVIAGLLVLLAAVSATHDERRYDAAVMRTLGAVASQLRAVQVAEFGPFAPKRMDTCPAAKLMIAAGIKNGEILRGPPLSNARCSRSIVANPPIPEAR